MKTFAIANQKGGVGKSTTTYHLAAALTTLGRKVLVIDADPQGNLSSVIAAEIEPDWVGLADVLSTRSGDVTVRDALVPGIWSGLTVLPTPKGTVLGMVRDELVVAGTGRERRLAEALGDVEGDYDVCLIDCPPSLDQLTINALTAAAQVLIVTHARLWASDGLAQLLGTIDEVRRYYNQQLGVAGVVVNQYEKNTVTGRERLDEMQDSFAAKGMQVLGPPIPKRTMLGDAPESSTRLEEWGADGVKLAEIYTGIAKTITGADATRTNGAL